MPNTDSRTRPNWSCEHPQTTHWHGTYACYALDACRCDDCKGAVRRYEYHRYLVATGRRPSDLVDAEPARRHVGQLTDQGMGLKRIAAVTGVAHGALWKLMYGKGPKGHRRKTRRVRVDTARRLLEQEADVADGVSVAATEAWQIVNELVGRGWTRAAIGRQVHGPNAKSLQLGRQQVMAGHLRTLRRLLHADVPPRRHPRGSTYPAKGKPRRQWRHPQPITAGVPTDTAWAGAGRLTCRACGRPLAEHSLTDRCA